MVACKEIQYIIHMAIYLEISDMVYSLLYTVGYTVNGNVYK